MDIQEQILRLQGIFRGNPRVIGQASNDLVDEGNGKWNQTKRGFAQGPATSGHWQDHLNGFKSLGLVPIDDYQKVKFMAIDVDLDIMDHLKVTLVSLCAQVEAHGMPFVICRSKSGAAHLYVFFKDSVEVAPVRKTMMKMADFLGFSSLRPCEYFPHTSKLDPESNGKYINLPYFDAENTTRYAMDFAGNPLSLDDFLLLSESKMVTAKEFNGWNLPKPKELDLREVVGNGPPCLQTIYDQGIQDGTKNEILLQFGILFKRYNKETYRDNVEIVNQTRTNGNPHDSGDLTNTLNSLAKKSLHYSCSHPCMAAICAKSLCMTRKYGITPKVEVPAIKEILQWGANDEYFEIVFESGIKVKILAERFIDFQVFRGTLMQALHIVVPEPKKFDWQEWVTTIMSKVRRVEVPKEFNIEHSIKSLIISYATSRTVGTKMEELLVSKPVRDGEDIVIRQKDIQAEILKRRFPGYVDNLELSVVINELQGSMTVKQIEGHIIPVFIIPDPKINQEDLVEKVSTDFANKY